jgi:hypothetical protein
MRNKVLVLVAAIALCLIASAAWGVTNPWFIRGDANNDGNVDISDVSAILGSPACPLAADVDDDGDVDSDDADYLQAYVFNPIGNPPPPAPFPDCGPDPTNPQPGDDCSGCTSPPPEGPASVPSISETGLLVLVLLLMASAFWVMRRRRMSVTRH